MFQSSHRGAAEMNPTRNHEVAGLIPGHDQWVKDLALLWCRSAAIALVRPLPWDPPYASGVALKKKKKKKGMFLFSSYTKMQSYGTHAHLASVQCTQNKHREK